MIPQKINVLFIKGVFLNSVRTDDVIIDESNKVHPHLQLLQVYKSWEHEEWLTQASVKCACCTTMTKRQIFIPMVIESNSLGLIYNCHSARFCTWPCAAWFIKHFMKNDDRYKLMLLQLYQLWEKQQIQEIAPSINPWRIIEFGGDLSIEAFHKINEFNFNRLLASFLSEDEPITLE